MIPSPCIKTCVLDRLTGCCIGCGRTGDEIGAWGGMSDAEQAALVRQLPARLARMTSRAGRREARHVGAKAG
jgi:predicted Fe-S protein YdhL (DUF1289 family)